MRQLDFFSPDRGGAGRLSSTADLMVFPVMNRIGLIRQTAALLRSRKTAEGQDAAWARTIAKLKSELASRGVDPADIDRHLQDFHRAVADELRSASQFNQPEEKDQA